LNLYVYKGLKVYEEGTTLKFGIFWKLSSAFETLLLFSTVTKACLVSFSSQSPNWNKSL